MAEYALGSYWAPSGEVIAQAALGRPAAIVQLYNDGEVCDLTKEPRKTLVDYCNCPVAALVPPWPGRCWHNAVLFQIRYECVPDLPTVFKELKETSTCVYEAVVQTGVVCDHPALKVPHVFASASLAAFLTICVSVQVPETVEQSEPIEIKCMLPPTASASPQQ